MIGITGYKQAEATSFSELPKLQPGGYVVKILNVKVEPTDWGSRLAIQFDIAEGEFKGFFDKLYKATPDEWENKKWKGSMRLSIPHNTGDETKFKKSLGYFKSQIQAFENSNANLHIDCERDWDENVLKGKLVGALFNEKEWEMNGNTGWFTQCKRFVPVNDIRSGNFTIPKREELKNKPSTASNDSFDPNANLSDFVEINAGNDTVPF
ncbi:hypothetical protein [Ruminococcus sp.]|jgi:hypothetical protein|uniref:hypothetical protein n=1 Tax=Ruminococcus sp. TaxID=41978 RepID=UPI001896F46A|nr:MAG TPA: hypothetical protein [Caudoviricetes sp.]DAS07816.1 MAG TPA: hypothetical protein [Caudoviricetes sp.]